MRGLAPLLVLLDPRSRCKTPGSFTVCRQALLYFRGLAMRSLVRRSAFFASTQMASRVTRRLLSETHMLVLYLTLLRLQHGVFRKPIPNWTAFWNTECQFRITNGIAVWSLGKDPRSSLRSEIPALLVEVLCMLHCMRELRAKRRHATQPLPT